MGICSLFFSEIKKGSVFEIKGNFAEDDDYDKLRSGKAQWNAPKYYPSAYIGQIVVDDGGFFRGWLIDNQSSRVEHVAIVGRFLKGRNDRVDMIFSTIYNDCYRFWMKKKLHKMSDFSVVNSPRYYYEEWDDELILCSINGNTHGDLQSCIDEANTGNTITLLDNTRGHDILVDSGKDITLDLNGYTLSNDVTTSNPVITNRGKLTVINGTISSAASAGVFNNEGVGEFTIGNGARIIATGTRQGIYNDSTKLVISDGAYISATASARATVQNHGNGQLIITGGTIISTRQEAVKVEGGTAAVNNASRITATESGAASVGIDTVVAEVIDGVTYKIVYYQ